MKISGFMLAIPEGRELTSGHVEMKHGQTYRIRLGNFFSTRCDAILRIDGETVGRWRLESGQCSTIERPATSNGKFTFLVLDSVRGQGLKRNTETGLIVAEFYPEDPEPLEETVLFAKPRMMEEQPPTHNLPENAEIDTHDAGGTALTGHSNQAFKPAPSMRVFDTPLAVISLRLVARKSLFRFGWPKANPVPEPLT
jgi:hypothetical protein